MKVPGTRITDRREEWAEKQYNGTDREKVARTVLKRATGLISKIGIIRLFRNERYTLARRILMKKNLR